jgi:hypothetical protein
MAEPPSLQPQSFEILAVRELRKAGFEVGQLRTYRRSELPEPEHGFVLELVIPLGTLKASLRALVVCRRQSGGLGADVVESAKARLIDASADAAIIFGTADFAPEALAAAAEGGVALLRVADGRDVFRASGWGDAAGAPEHYPAWLPAHVAQLVDRDSAGQVRLRVLEAGRPEMLLDCLHLHSRT